MRRKEQAEASRAGLIEAARQVFTAHGYEATTVAEILDRAGMARGALYHYFPGGKREVFQAVFETINDEFHRRRDALLELDSPLARIGAGVRIFLELCTEDDFARIALVDAPQLVPGQSERGTTYALLRANLEQARTAREIRRCDIDVTAMALYGAIRAAGEFVMTAEQRQKAAKTAARSLDLLLDGLRDPG